MTRFRASLALGLSTLMLAACTGAPTPSKGGLSSLPEAGPLVSPDMAFTFCAPVTIEAQVVDFTVDAEDAEPRIKITEILAEYPTTPGEMKIGLQGRSDLHPHTAMLIPFDGEHNPVLWMKDTPSSLDMVFIDADGVVFHLETGTEPNSTGFITPEEPFPVATHVLELAAGRAADFGIFPGETTIEIGALTLCPGRALAA